MNFPDIPKVFMIPSFASLIPSDMPSLTLPCKKLHIKMMLEMDRVINRNKQTDIFQIIKYHDTAFNSSILDNNKRLALCVKLDILDVNMDKEFVVKEDMVKVFEKYNMLEDQVSLLQFLQLEVQTKTDMGESSGISKHARR